MNKNLIIGVIVILVIIGVGWFLMRNQMTPSMPTETTEQMIPPTDSTTEESTSTGVMESTESLLTDSSVKEFTVTGSNFKFDTPEIKVKEGDTVKITFKNSGGFHDFVIDEFNVKTKQTEGPTEETVTFVADKPGEYEFYCSVGQHKQMGMRGAFIVE